ncbi:endoribonuclease Dcr-2 [Musca vetustissima]|uniref:endoribonuclease Dcr-2 n=1 Tax=Musca vetustissima TaxID=27455 RepID=UPI002AB74F56|nr:endoribonuclease Dcr-2 [Musca vetustissima]
MVEITEENCKEIIKPRPYQLDLVQYVMERNGIIYLPTGAGKTFVAILALKKFAHTLQKTIKNGGKRAIFMCNTVELARQQAEEIRKTTNLKTGIYIGDRDVDNWQRRKWETEIEENQVLVGTAQIFVDIVSQNLIKVNDLSVVVIDECHHATGGHPMKTFLSMFPLQPTEGPRVIGLTGVLIKGNKLGNVISDLRTLESTMRGNIITVRSAEEMQNVMVFSTKPFEELVSYTSNRHTFQVETKIKQLVEECKAFIDNWSIGAVALKMTKGLQGFREPNKKNSAKNLLNDFIYQMDDLGLYSASIAIMSLIIEFEVKKRQSDTIALRDMYRRILQDCERIRHIICHELKEMLDVDDEMPINDKDIHTLNIILNYSTPKLRALLSNIRDKFKNKQAKDIACLIFVDRRYTAKCLYHVVLRYVELCPDLRDIIRPQFMVGRQNILCSIESVLDAKWQKSAIKEFRDHECNMIICSNVLEEGIDVQACNYVFTFDPLKTFNSYIQTKGRARSKNSFYTIFAPEADKMKMVEQIRKYRQIHEEIKTFLITRCLERDDPSESEIAEQFVDLIPPYVIPSGAKLLAASALALLNRYCVSLPWDSFGQELPWYMKLPPREKDGKIAVSVTLPLQSTVRETITSDYMATAKEAKISAAFKACVRLYENGELNNFLLPITKKECIAKVSNDLFKHWEKFDDNVCSKTVGKQQARIYKRKCPEELYNALPRLGVTSYAYSIEYATDFPLNSYNEHIDKYFKQPATYAILSSKKLPKLAEMPLFMSQGKIRIKINEVPIAVTLHNEQQLKQLQQFHTMVFKDILKLWRHFLVMDQRNKDYSFLIVPLNGEKQIDWPLVANFPNMPPKRVLTPNERRNAQHYNPDDYLDRVVTKWYSDRDHENFLVTQIHTDLTPYSPFDGQTHANYAEFYKSRYNLEIYNGQQFLLEVKPLTHRRNFFNNAHNKSIEKKKETSRVILIPELCHNYQYPANLWLKALLLPSILHRIVYMLHAEQLRQRINAYLGLERYFADYEPQPLIIDVSLKRVLDDDDNLIQEKEYTKSICSIPAKENATTNDYQVTSLDDASSWKSYLEPVDLNRRLNSSYPVEIDYYYKFISDLLVELENMRVNEEEEWTKCQLNAHVPKQIVGPGSPSSSTGVQRLSILDTPPSSLAVQDKTQINILKLNFIPDSKLKSAEQYEFLAALTTAGVNDVFDMERYELLGDAFLKFSASLYLTNKYTTWNEGYLSIIKSRMVSNRNLLYCLLDSDISQRICSSPFKPNTTWLPPLCSLPSNLLDVIEKYPAEAGSMLEPQDFYNLQLTEPELASGKCSAEKLERFTQACTRNTELLEGNITVSPENEINMYIYQYVLRDKIVADTLEALLGVCVKNYGIHRSFRMLEFFGICKSERDKPLTNLLDLKLSGTHLRTNVSRAEVNAFLLNIDYLEKNLGYQFKDRAYLLQALTHPSYPTNRITGCYQELEFIGDAILDMLMTCYIFERYETMDPGKMTDLRSALVNNITLACICVRYRFHLFLLYENSRLSEAIKTFADFQETQDHRVTNQVRILMEESSNEGTTKSKYNMSEKIDVPKALGDIVEAIIGAIYLDCRDLEKTWQVIYKLFENELQEFSHEVPIDPVRQLGEIKQANPIYYKPIVDRETVMVKCVFNCLDRSVTTNGFGSNAILAKKAAAKQALQILAKNGN